MTNVKSIDPTVIPIDGLVLQPVDLKTMLGNVLTAYCAGNRRSAWKTRIADADIIHMLEKVKQPLTKWMDDKEFSIVDAKKRLEALPQPMRQLISGLFERPREVTDYGEDLRQGLLGGGKDYWTAEYVALPSLGYARPLLIPKHDTTLATKGFEGAAPYTHVPSLCSQWNMGVAFALIRSDLTRWSESLMPASSKFSAGPHVARDQPWGSLLSLDHQLKTIWSLFGLYLTQGSLLVAHANRRLMERATQIRMTLDVRSQPALLAREESIRPLFDVRMHPIISALARALSTGTALTYHGDSDLLYLHGEVTKNKDGEADIGQSILTDALNDFGSKKADTWGDCNVEGNAAPVSMSVFARQMLSLGELHDQWNTFATQLGWSDVTMDVGPVRQKSARWILTDGINYGAPPAAGLLGITPVLSLGNLRSGGYMRRFQADFDAGEKPHIEYWTMVVDGFQAATGSEQSYERLYHPAGMDMGEDSTEPVRVDVLSSDPLIASVVEYFDRQSKTYVQQYYGDPTGTHDEFKATDWDGYAKNGSAEAANFALAAGYVGQVKPAKASDYRYRSRFFHRFPVRRAVTPDMLFFSTSGIMRRRLPQDGNVVFDDTLEVMHSSADLEKLVSSASMKPGGVTAVLPAPSEQVDEGV